MTTNMPQADDAPAADLAMTDDGLSLYAYAYEHARAGNPHTLVLFHGTGGEETSFMGLGRIVAPDMARISIRGDVNEFGNLRFFKRVGDGVYDMDDLVLRTERLADFIPDALAEHGRFGDQVVAIGYSNGANILANLLFEHPSLFRAAVLMHPLIPFEPANRPGLEGKPVLITAGQRDPILPTGHVDHVAGLLEARGSVVSRFVHAGGHEVPGEELEAIAGWIAGQTSA